MPRPVIVLAFGWALSCCGCLAVGGTTKPPTVGEELKELKAAYESGLMSQDEYAHARQTVLARQH